MSAPSDRPSVDTTAAAEATTVVLAPGNAAAPETAHEGVAALPRMGRFALVRKIGEGGMGAVFVGYDEALDRKVAVKVLHRGAAGAQWLLREAQALAKLSHPNVVPVYEVGEHGGRVFLAMEYVSGTTLRAHLRESGDPNAALRLFLQAGRGLAAAHAAGLVHRDFKPDNVLVGRDGRARVVDFGIAALSEADAEPMPVSRAPGTPISASPNVLGMPMTQTGALMGTPAFMSPEQFHGERATAKSDQFSFCVALYSAMYGQRPFDGADLVEIGQAVTTGLLRPPPPGSEAPDWLWPLLERGLATAPEERFPSMAALLAAIEQRLPAAPDLDPMVTQKARRTAFGMLFLHWMVMVGYHAWQGLDVSPLYLLGMAVAELIVGALIVALLWKELKKNLHGRHLGGLIVVTLLMLAAHRVVAVRLGTPVRHIFVIDTLLFTAMFAIGAILMDLRLAGVCVVGLAATVAGAVYPGAAFYLFAALSLLGITVGLVLNDRLR